MRRLAKVFLALVLFTFFLNHSEASLPVIKNISFETYPDRVEVIFELEGSVNLVFYSIEDPPQVIADAIGNAFVVHPRLPEFITINQGQIKSIRVFRDESLGQRITAEGRRLDGVDFIIIELGEMVDFKVRKIGNIYYLYLAKTKDVKLQEEYELKMPQEREDKREIETELPKEEEVTRKQLEEEKPLMSKKQLARHWREVGFRHQKTNEFEKALECYKKAIEHDPEYPGAYNDLGVIYFYLGKPGKAIEEFKTALEINPNYLGAYTNLAIVYEEIGRLDEALECWTKRATLTRKKDYWSKKAEEKIKELKR
jgi:tetratricopeptide (TPR) repeat protein